MSSVLCTECSGYLGENIGEKEPLVFPSPGWKETNTISGTLRAEFQYISYRQNKLLRDISRKKDHFSLDAYRFLLQERAGGAVILNIICKSYHDDAIKYKHHIVKIIVKCSHSIVMIIAIIDVILVF
jgi:hypothetical protein